MLTRRAFWYLRHGETDWNAKNLSQGNVDIPLNDIGRAQAVTAANLLKNRGIRSIVASPLSRALDTAKAAAAVTGAPISLEDGLREVAFGVQEGQLMAEWFQQWVDGAHTPEGAESFPLLQARATRAINAALGHESVVLVVAHGALFRAIRAAMGLTANVRTPNAVPLFCEPGNTATDAWTLTPAT